MSNLILSQEKTSKKVKRLKQEGNTVGLAVGFFDCLNIRHVKLFKYAKKHVDLLVVGVETDESASMNISSGGERPINAVELRLEFLDEIESVDIVFQMEHTIAFSDPNASNLYKKLFKQIGPTHLITSFITDKFAQKKQEQAAELRMGFYGSLDTSFLS